MGPYCRYCNMRCFVLRVLKDARSMLLATCRAGMARDLEAVGETHETAVNPVTDPDAAAALYAARKSREQALVDKASAKIRKTWAGHGRPAAVVWWGFGELEKQVGLLGEVVVVEQRERSKEQNGVRAGAEITVTHNGRVVMVFGPQKRFAADPVRRRQR